MRTRDNGRPIRRPTLIRADQSPYDDARYRALMLGIGVRMPSSHPLPEQRPHRGQLPDVDLSLAVPVDRPSVLARLFDRLRRIARRRKPPPLVKEDLTA